MKNIKAFIVEDETKAKDMLIGLLKLYCEEVKVVGSANSIKMALDTIPNSEIDVLFLDINLQDGNGFNLLNHLKQIDFKVIFTTAYDQYAIKAIRYSALDYLLKPIDVDELETAIKRLNEGGNKTNSNVKQYAKDISDNGSPSKIGLPSKSGIEYIPHADIVKCEADSSYTIIYTISKQKHLISKNLKTVQQLLSDNKFIRCHRKYLVNKDYVKEYIRGAGGQVIMQDNSFALVSKRMKSSFLHQLEAS